MESKLSILSLDKVLELTTYDDLEKFRLTCFHKIWSDIWSIEVSDYRFKGCFGNGSPALIYSCYIRAKDQEEIIKKSSLDDDFRKIITKATKVYQDVTRVTRFMGLCILCDISYDACKHYKKICLEEPEWESLVRKCMNKHYLIYCKTTNSDKLIL